MKKYLKQLLAWTLCLALCVGNVISVQAANESNTLGVTFSASLDKEEIYTSAVDQTVVMTISASKEIATDTIGFTVTKPEAFNLSAITSANENIEFAASEVDLAKGEVVWSSSDGEAVSGITDIAKITFVIPADAAVDTYEVGIKELILASNYGTSWEDSATASTTLTITKAEAITGYAAGISASEDALEVDESVNINITADHASTEAFAAAEITVGYDSNALSFDAYTFQTSYPNVSADTSTSNTLKLVDHGASKSFGESGYVYTLPFKAIAAADNTNVTLSYAGFATQTEAETKDLAEAARNPESVTLNISEKSLSVTLPEEDILTGSTQVAYGDDYTFILADKDNYNYEITSVMMGDADVTASLVDNGDGTYTVPDVTGALVIASTRTAKSYSVTIDGNAEAGEVTGTTGETAAIYGQPYTFTVPVNSTKYSYEVAITIAGNTYEKATSESGEEKVTYTISGEDITGDIVINVTKTKLTADEVAVELPSGVDVTGEAKATIGESYTLTHTPESGYIYTVTATMANSDSFTLTEGIDDAGNKTYTIAEVTGAIIFNVTKSVDTSGISISQYITLNGTIMWLVKNTTAVAAGKVPTYNGEEMFWSDAYGSDADGDDTNDGAYCYLVISNESADNVTVAARDALGITTLTGTVAEVAYDNDVNETNKVDASDAQLAWNMYKAQYSEFTEDVTVAKFLEADVNMDKKVDTMDAAAIISAILGTTATN